MAKSTLLPKAVFTQKTFEKAFSLFSTCHSVYDSSTDDKISKLGKKTCTKLSSFHFTLLVEFDIDKFLAFYRDSFPAATVLPKMHFVEDHLIPFMRKSKTGLGFLGEQGAESIHARFNSIRCNYTNMPNRVQRLECILKEHLNQVCPDNIVRRPQPKKRPKTNSH